MKGGEYMPRDKNMTKYLLADKGTKLTPEQEELLDSGLRMLAHMIVETHLKRIKSDPEYHNKLRRRHDTDAAK